MANALAVPSDYRYDTDDLRARRARMQHKFRIRSDLMFIGEAFIQANGSLIGTLEDVETWVRIVVERQRSYERMNDIITASTNKR